MTEEQKLSRTEATLAVNWFNKQGITVKSGWIELYKRTPSEIADEYEVELQELLDAIRR
jgi:hypothetical protein